MSTMMNIYVLIDPRDSAIRYVGMTQHTLQFRLRLHLREKKSRGHKVWWVQKLVRIGMPPRIDLIQQVPIKFGPDAERYWISYFRATGCDLTNVTDGGEGTHGFKYSDEQKAKISTALKASFAAHPERKTEISRVHSGKIISESHKAIMSASASERWRKFRDGEWDFKPSAKENFKLEGERRRGYKRSEESCQKQSKTMTGKPKSPEHRAKLADNCRRISALGAAAMKAKSMLKKTKKGELFNA
jgi:hypothetical protein